MAEIHILKIGRGGGILEKNIGVTKFKNKICAKIFFDKYFFGEAIFLRENIGGQNV
jgi:hypothetical protein